MRLSPAIVLAALACILTGVSPMALGQDSALIGTWSLKSFVREVSGTGERYDQLGEHPKGYLGYSSDGRMYAIFVAGDRIRPRDETPTDEERVKLHKTMIAYAGTYSVDNGKVIHHVDVSEIESRTGSDQVRFYKVTGDTLTIRTAPNKSPIDGREGVGILEFIKVK
jgi:hypothetical protein